MRLRIPNQKFIAIVQGNSTSENTLEIDAIAYDSRKIGETSSTVFFALEGVHSDGHNYLEKAYEKGIRMFVVSKKTDFHWKDAQIITVENCWNALFRLASHQRSHFKGKIVAISGKAGKTTVKEWLYHLLTPEQKVSRSPKSFNSQLGIALSLIGLHPQAAVGIIEVKPHAELNPELINSLLKPTIGVWLGVNDQLTSEGFGNEYVHQLFKGVTTFIHSEKNRSFDFSKPTKTIEVQLIKKEKTSPEFLENSIHLLNASSAFTIAKELTKDEKILKEKLKTLPVLALRLETFEGINGNFIINDAYNLDVDALRNSLEYQQTIAHGKPRCVIIGLNEKSAHFKKELMEIIREYQPDAVQFVQSASEVDYTIQNSIILIKGARNSEMNRVAVRFKDKGHKTRIYIDLKALRKNILAHKQLLPKETKIMAMVKAAGYGSGLQKMVQFVDSFGVDYFGVAYVDEGVEIRNSGIKKPIMVMNAENGNFEACIQHQLEPAIYDFQQLDEFISECIYQGVENFPIHLKIDTGMNRLGFSISELDKVLEIIQSQPEVKIQSVYSHLADADNRRDKRFTEHQLQKFSGVVKKIHDELPYSVDSHILNSSGIANYSETHFSMVRIGIGMYGICSNPELKRKLQPVLSWFSSISQIRSISAGQSVGYNRTFISSVEMKIATIPVGYADGFKRSLSNGKGYVVIKGKKCPTIGRVCMDMIMVDVTGMNVHVGEDVEIIGKTITLEKMAELQETIPYEIMTSISGRVHRMYIE